MAQTKKLLDKLQVSNYGLFRFRGRVQTNLSMSVNTHMVYLLDDLPIYSLCERRTPAGSEGTTATFSLDTLDEKKIKQTNMYTSIL